jgi:hypothetical protein
MQPTIRSQQTNLAHHTTPGGVTLILCGIAAILFRQLGIDAYLVILASAGLLVLGSARKQTAMMVIGCLLSGAGPGILVYAGPWNIPPEFQKGLFMLCIALSWFLIPIFTSLFTTRAYWLALIPGAISVLLAGAFLVTNNPWDIQVFSLGRSFATLIIAIDLILIGFTLVLPWFRMVRTYNQRFSHINTKRKELSSDQSF